MFDPEYDGAEFEPTYDDDDFAYDSWRDEQDRIAHEENEAALAAQAEQEAEDNLMKEVENDKESI